MDATTPTDTSVSGREVPGLEVVAIEKRYGDFTAVKDLSFSVGPGEFVSVVGPSGAGKSTMLRACAGLHPVSAGEVRVAGTAIAGSPPERLMVVFQDYSRSLFPWLSVGGNITLALKDHGLSKSEARDRAEQALADVDLAGTASSHLWELSGGMQQRVAIARALALDPDVLLLDEPFASVDAQTRESLEDLVVSIWAAKPGLSVLLVTHDIDEAVYMSDRVLVTTPTPMRIFHEVPIALPRPRSHIDTKSLPEYGRCRADVERALRAGIAGQAPPGASHQRPPVSAIN